MPTNNCPCLLCHLGRSCNFVEDIASLDAVRKGIEAYAGDGKHHISDAEKQAMIAYLEKRQAPNGTIRFDYLEEYYWEKAENEQKAESKG